MNTLLTKTLALGALAFTAAASQGAVLSYGTFTGTDPDSTDTVQTIGALGGFAIGLSTTTTHFLTDASFDLSGTRPARLRIFEGDMQGDGGLLVYTSGNVAPAGTSAITTFSGINLTLNSGTSYWLTVDGSAGGTSVFVHNAEPPVAPSGAAGLGFIDARFSNTSNDTLSDANTTSFGANDIPNFTVTVPEPHEYAMIAGLGLCAFAAYRRRSTRAVA